MIEGTDLVAEYATFMNEIFRRLDAISESLEEISADPTHANNWKNCDFCWTQIRRICEYLTLAIVLAHHRESESIDDLTKWRPKDLLAQVEKLSHHPQPVQIASVILEGDTGEKQLQPLAQPIDGKIISQIYGRCSNLLHVGSLERILNSKMPPFDISQLVGWLDGFERLLRSHVLLLPKIHTVLVCLSREGKVGPAEFFLMAGEGEAAFDITNLPPFKLLAS